MPEQIKSIGEIFSADPAFAKIRNVLEQSDIVIEFEKIFPDLGKIAKAVKAEKNILYLRVENAAWRSELKYKEKILIDKINKYFNSERVKAVKFVS